MVESSLVSVLYLWHGQLLISAVVTAWLGATLCAQLLLCLKKKCFYHQLYYHVLGMDQEQDVLCCEFPDNPKWMM